MFYNIFILLNYNLFLHINHWRDLKLYKYILIITYNEF